MGTSSSSKGPGNKGPLVPPWADIDGEGPGPVPDAARFKAFRTSLGRFVASTNSADLRSALRHYAHTATGGRTQGPRRFGAMARTGGALFGALSEMTAGGAAVQVGGVDLSTLNGSDTDVAIQAIVRALTPPDGDGEKVAAAMTVALSECLEGLEEFDFASITEDMLISIMLAYLRECVFEQVVMDSDRAFQREGSGAAVEDAERSLHALVGSVVEMEMRPLFGGQVRTLSREQVERIQMQAIAQVWAIWEGYE